MWLLFQPTQNDPFENRPQSDTLSEDGNKRVKKYSKMQHLQINAGENP